MNSTLNWIFRACPSRTFHEFSKIIPTFPSFSSVFTTFSSQFHWFSSFDVQKQRVRKEFAGKVSSMITAYCKLWAQSTGSYSTVVQAIGRVFSCSRPKTCKSDYFWYQMQNIFSWICPQPVFSREFWVLRLERFAKLWQTKSSAFYGFLQVFMVNKYLTTRKLQKTSIYSKSHKKLESYEKKFGFGLI